LKDAKIKGHRALLKKDRLMIDGRWCDLDLLKHVQLKTEMDSPGERRLQQRSP
jgi:hypothetical protein